MNPNKPFGTVNARNEKNPFAMAYIDSNVHLIVTPAGEMVVSSISHRQLKLFQSLLIFFSYTFIPIIGWLSIIME